MMKNEQLVLYQSTQREDHYYDQLRNNLKEANISKLGDYEKDQSLLLIYHDKKKKLIAGLFATYGLGNFYIDLLWVDAAHRHQKIGSQLLDLAEDYAKKQGMLYIRVNTATFQAFRFLPQKRL